MPNDPLENSSRVYDIYARWEMARDHGTPFNLAEECSTPEEQAAVEKLITDLNPSKQPVSEDRSLPPNTERYTFTRFIAQGGMGEVYEAIDKKFQRLVAIKVLRRKLGISREAFQKEANLVAKLSHPGIVPIHDFGELPKPDHRPFLVMKLVEGRTLEDVLSETGESRISIPRRVQLFEQICQTVAYAHRQNPPLLHRDIKPLNVMSGEDGEIYVMDWGIAKFVASSDQNTSEVDQGMGTHRGETAIIGTGTHNFIPPEQANRAKQLIGTASDVFALGGILCQMLTGEPTYTRRTPPDHIKKGELTETYARLDRCGEDPELIALAKRMLEKDVSKRIPNASEAAKAIRDYQEGVQRRLKEAEIQAATEVAEREKAEARENEAKAVAAKEIAEREKAEVKVIEERKRRQVERKKRRMQLALAGAVLLLVAGGLSFAWWEGQQASKRRAEQQQVENDKRTAELKQRFEDEQRAAAERGRLARNGEAAAALLKQCEDALRGDDAARSEPALDQAEKRRTEGGTNHLADRFARCRTDLDMLRDLDRVNDWLWTPVGGRRLHNDEELGAAWRAAFLRFGIIPGTTPLDEAVRRIEDSHVRDAILTALHTWLQRSRAAGVLVLLHAADADTFRCLVRDAIVAQEHKKLLELADRPAALTQPAWFAPVLGSIREIAPDKRARLLRTALDRNPENFTLLMTLGSVDPLIPMKKSAEREKWCRAALAVRPSNALAWNNLGLVLFQQQDYDGAITAYEKAIRLDPKFSNAYFGLACALHRKGDMDGEIAVFRKATTANPTDATAHWALVNALTWKGDYDHAIKAYHDANRIKPKMVDPFYLDLALKRKAEQDKETGPPPRGVKP